MEVGGQTWEAGRGGNNEGAAIQEEHERLLMEADGHAIISLASAGY